VISVANEADVPAASSAVWQVDAGAVTVRS
jgi:hypothetical protein